MPLQGTVSLSSASTQTLTSSSSIYVYSGAAAAVWTLPAVSSPSGEMLILYNRGSAAVTVQTAGSDQIDNQGQFGSSIVLTPGKSMELINDGTYWLVITSAAPLPAYDNSAQGADRMSSKVNNNSAYTWTQTVAAGNPYGLVAVYSPQVGTPDPMTITSAAVTFGGVTLSSIGFGISNTGWAWLFGGANIPSGSQTVSVTLTQSGQTFGIIGFSHTYLNVTALGVLDWGQDNFGDPAVTLPRMTANPARIWYTALMSGQPTVTASAVTKRQLYPGGGGVMTYSGDRGICGPETGSYLIELNANTVWMAGGLELYGQPPSSPYLQYVGGQLQAGGPFTDHTFTHNAVPGAYVLVAISYWKDTGTSLGAVTYGGTAMTQLASSYFNNDTTGASGQLFIYGLASAPGGIKTVSMTYTGGTPVSVEANSISYGGVNTVGTATSVTGRGTSLSQGPVTCAAGQVIFQCFGSQQQLNETDAALNLTTIWNSSIGNGALTVTQSTAASTTFTATNGSTGSWAGIALVLS